MTVVCRSLGGKPERVCGEARENALQYFQRRKAYAARRVAQKQSALSAPSILHGHTSTVTRQVWPDKFRRAADRIRPHQPLLLHAGIAYRHPQVSWAEFWQGRYRIGLALHGD